MCSGTGGDGEWRRTRGLRFSGWNKEVWYVRADFGDGRGFRECMPLLQKGGLVAWRIGIGCVHDDL